jgi:hypothetical protein
MATGQARRYAATPTSAAAAMRRESVIRSPREVTDDEADRLVGVAPAERSIVLNGQRVSPAAIYDRA